MSASSATDTVHAESPSANHPSRWHAMAARVLDGETIDHVEMPLANFVAGRKHVHQFIVVAAKDRQGFVVVDRFAVQNSGRHRVPA
ncbi:MAG: hypothetical protein AAF958_13410, partial [Planctomycetota bacterium]